MKQLALLGVAALGITRLCSAAPACTGGDLASYISLGSLGCTIGPNTLFDFQIVQPTAGATEIAASAITLTPSGARFDPGIAASVSAVASSGTILEAFFTYQIAGNLYTNSSITLSNSFETGDGAVSDVQNFCVGGPFGMDGCTGTPGSLVALDGVQNQDSASFPPNKLLSVTDDLTIDGGLKGTASGGTISDRFTAVPEPATFPFAALGLGLVLRSARAKYRRRSVR